MGEDQLRYLDIFASAAAPEAKTGKRLLLDQANAIIENLLVREGFFRPADPQSTEERERFKTGDEIFAREQAERAQARSKYPQPLRALVQAEEKPDDSDMVAYISALNAVRTNPDPALFHQLVTWMNEDHVKFSSYLGDILVFDDPPPELQRWKKLPRRAAARAVIEALPVIKKPSVLEEVLILVLKSQGGGKLKFSIPGTEATIDLVAKKRSEGYTLTYGCDGLSETNISQVAAYCQGVLARKYAELWPKMKSGAGTRR